MTQDERLRKFAIAGGWVNYSCDSKWCHGSHWRSPSKVAWSPLPDFPNDLTACFEVLERACSDKWFWRLALKSNGQILATIYDKYRDIRYEAEAETKQLAIIYAVLGAVEGSK